MYYERKPYTVTSSDESLIDALAELLFRAKRAIDLPFIVWDLSYETPARVCGCMREEDSPFDTEQLGFYTPATYTITLLEKPIASAAAKLNVDKDILRSIVLIHEIGHYITHCPADVLLPHWKEMVESAKEFWKDSGFMLECGERRNHIADPSFLNRCSRKYIETVAQLFTYLVVREKPEHLDAFEKLASVQSGDYTAFQRFPDIDAWHLLRAMRFVRNTDYHARTCSIKDTDILVKDKDLDRLMN